MDLWSFARYTLRLSEEDFWRLTLRKLAALRKRYDAECRRMELSSAIIAATIVNWMGRPDKPVEYWRFMPSNWGKEDELEQQQNDQMTGNALWALTKRG